MFRLFCFLPSSAVVFIRSFSLFFYRRRKVCVCKQAKVAMTLHLVIAFEFAAVRSPNRRWSPGEVVGSQPPPYAFHPFSPFSLFCSFQHFSFLFIQRFQPLSSFPFFPAFLALFLFPSFLLFPAFYFFPSILCFPAYYPSL